MVFGRRVEQGAVDRDLKGTLVSLLGNNVYLVFACYKNKVQNTHAIFIEEFTMGAGSNPSMYLYQNRFLVLFNGSQCIIHEFGKDIVYELFKDVGEKQKELI